VVLFNYACRSVRPFQEQIVLPATTWRQEYVENLDQTGAIVRMRAGHYAEDSKSSPICRMKYDGAVLAKEGVLRFPFLVKVPVTHANFASSPHFPVKLRISPLLNGTYAGFIRDPRQRALSAFNHNKHSFGLYGKGREDMIRNTPTLLDFVSHSRIHSCMTKMLLGLSCSGSPDKLPIPLAAALPIALHTLVVFPVCSPFCLVSRSNSLFDWVPCCLMRRIAVFVYFRWNC